MSSPSLIAAPEAADLLGITVHRLYELSREGVVPSVRLGRSFRYSPVALHEFIRTGGVSWAGGWRKSAGPTDASRAQDAGNGAG